MPLRVSIRQAARGGSSDSVPEQQAFLDLTGARIILGGSRTHGLVAPVVPTERALFAPRGACVACDGSLWVADTGHHRVLGWPGFPEEDDAPAAILIGQPSFNHEGRNAGRDPGSASLNVPTGIAPCGNGLALADAWNHRVLIWREPPRVSNCPADIVLGQEGFDVGERNRGRDGPSADTLFWPFGVLWDGAHLWVADTGNRRVLMWEGVPSRCGQPADLVLGQQSFACRDENGGAAPSTASMRWPHGVARLGERLCVADAGNNRIMVWNAMPRENGMACDAILGQRTCKAVDHNQGDYWPHSGSLNMPYAVAALGDLLLVADTANSRVLAWRADSIRGQGATACALAGQPDWSSKGENRWHRPARDSLCWPYGIATGGKRVIIADAGNNRVLIWDPAEI